MRVVNKGCKHFQQPVAQLVISIALTANADEPLFMALYPSKDFLTAYEYLYLPLLHLRAHPARTKLDQTPLRFACI